MARRRKYTSRKPCYPRILSQVDEELVMLLQQTMQQAMQQQAIDIHKSFQVEAIVHSGQDVFVEYMEKT